jgi:hypothetical protein
MILDKMAELALAQNVFSAGTDVASTNVYDTGAAADVGAGENLFLFAKMATALAGGTSIQVVLQDSADNSSWADVQSAKAVLLASATANAVLCKMRLPIGLRRYLRIAWRSVGTTTAGTGSAYITKDVDAQQYSASGFTVQ